MKRTQWSAIAVVATMAFLLVPTALGSHTPPISRGFFADTEASQLRRGGSASSSIMVFGNGAITVQVNFLDQVPRERWTAQIYDRGTCAAPRTVVANLGTLTMGGGGTATRTVSLNAAQRALLRNALAAGRHLVLRISHGSERACERFDEVDAEFFEPHVPEPSFEPTAPIVTADPFADN
jgi:hypothetical protein